MDEKTNIFFTTDHRTKTLLNKIFKVQFNNDYAVHRAQLLRKEIIPLIKKELEK